jgi:hypothetical protein
MSAEEIIGAFSTQSYATPHYTVEKSVRVRYEVWQNNTLVLRTHHETQATRYAREVEGEVRSFTYTR